MRALTSGGDDQSFVAFLRSPSCDFLVIGPKFTMRRSTMCQSPPESGSHEGSGPVWGKKKTATDRRRGRRKPVQWEGRWSVLGDAAATWSGSPCTVQDVSPNGARLLLLGDMDVRKGQTLLLTIEYVGGTPVGLRLRGTVRNVSPPSADGLSVGVEVALDASNARIAKTLLAG